jgi:hypothetical protein
MSKCEARIFGLNNISSFHPPLISYQSAQWQKLPVENLPSKKHMKEHNTHESTKDLQK